MKPLLLLLIGLVSMLGSAVATPVLAEETEADLVVYSSHKESLFNELIKSYQDKAGILIELNTDSADKLISRMMAEGTETPADLFVATDATSLWQAAEKGLLTQVRSSILTQYVPPTFREPGNLWFGLTKRPMVIAYNKTRMNPNELSTYEELANPKWRQRLCLVSSKKPQMLSLVAMFFQRVGEQGTEKMVQGWSFNMTKASFASDIALLEALVEGKCDVGLVNPHHVVELLKKDSSLPLGVFWPNQATLGTHVSFSGAGVTRYAKNPEDAQRFLEWMVQVEAQGMFAARNYEYPVNHQVQSDNILVSFGQFKSEETPLSQYLLATPQVSKMMDRAGYR